MAPRRSFLERLVDSALSAANSLLEGVGKGAERVQEVLAPPPPPQRPAPAPPPARGPARRLRLPQTPTRRRVSQLEEENNRLRELVERLREEVEGPVAPPPPPRPAPEGGGYAPRPRYPRIWNPFEQRWETATLPEGLGIGTKRGPTYINFGDARTQYEEIVQFTGPGYSFLIQRGPRRYEVHVYQSGRRPA